MMHIFLLLIILLSVQYVHGFGIRYGLRPVPRPKRQPFSRALFSPSLSTDLFKMVSDMQDTLNEIESMFSEESEFGQMPIPSTDLKEIEGAYQVHIDLPGIKKDEVNIEIKDNVLSVHGERRVFTPEECANIARDTDEFKDKCDPDEYKYHHQQRFFGSFESKVVLPEDIVDDLSSVQAKYVDGVLDVTIPKKHLSAPKDKSYKINIA